MRQTPLHYSVTNLRAGVMEALVAAGAEVNTRRMKDGWTPLFLASIFGFSDKVQHLVDRGADVLLCDDRGFTVMDWAARYGLTSTTGVLKKAPRTVTEMSGKKYVECERGELDVPVEFDEGINKLLVKLEAKRKAKIQEHQKLLEKMEQDKRKEMEKLEDKIGSKSEDESDSSSDLLKATENILRRQRKNMEEIMNKDTPEENKPAFRPRNSFKESINALFDATSELDQLNGFDEAEEETRETERKGQLNDDTKMPNESERSSGLSNFRQQSTEAQKCLTINETVSNKDIPLKCSVINPPSETPSQSESQRIQTCQLSETKSIERKENDLTLSDGLQPITISSERIIDTVEIEEGQQEKELKKSLEKDKSLNNNDVVEVKVEIYSMPSKEPIALPEREKQSQKVPICLHTERRY